MTRDVIRIDKTPSEPKKPRWPRRVSAKKQAELERGELAASIEIVKARSRGACEIQWTSIVCAGEGSQVHHKVLGRHDGCHDPELLLWTCGPCHATAHANPEAAMARRVILSKYPGRR